MNITPSSVPDTAPVHDSLVNNQLSRIFSLDVLRGLALLGILVISIWEFGGFTGNRQIFYQTGIHGGNHTLLTTVSFLFEGKMRALFAMVFGAGIILFLQKKEHPVAISNADAYIRRMMWLMIFGLFNAFILLWPGDILFQFGVMGILLFAFTRMKAKGFFIAAILCTLIYCGKQYWNYQDDKENFKKYNTVMVLEKKFKEDSTTRAKKDSVDRTKDTTLIADVLAKNKLTDSLAHKKDTLTKKQAEEKETWEGTIKSLKYDSAKTVSENKAMHASYTKVWNHLLKRSQNKEASWLYRIGIWDLGSMMFLGMTLLSIGFFSGRFSSSKYLNTGILFFIAGLALAWFRLHFNAVRLVDYAKYIENHSLPYNLFFPLERLLMAIGYASVVMFFLRAGILNFFWRLLSSLGQMALSNYILQSIICSFFFYGYGFGYFGRLAQWQLYFIVLEIALVQVVFSVLWLRYYTSGPLEWLWRCLIYLKWLPIKKQITTDDATALTTMAE